MKATKLIKISFVFVAIIFLIAGGCLFTYRKQALQSEAKTYLAAIATCEISYFGENNSWGTTFKHIGWEPVSETRYAFYLSCEEVIPASVTGYRDCPPELKKWFETHKTNPDPPKGGFFAAAVGNLDKDPKLDIWVIDQRKTPENLVSDLKK